jgi:NADH-quinone oxidoreductase subunit N
MITTIGAFICLLIMRRNGKAVENINDLAGLSQHDKTTAYLFAIILFSLIGIPPLAGFWGKWFVFLAAIESKLYLLAIIGFVTSVVGAYYYLRVIKVMFFDKPAAPFEKPLGNVNAALLAGSSAFVIFFVVAPSPLIEAASVAAKSLFP